MGGSLSCDANLTCRRYLAEGEELGSNLLRAVQSSLGGPGGSGSFLPLTAPYPAGLVGPRPED